MVNNWSKKEKEEIRQKAPATNYLSVQQQWNRIDFPSLMPSSTTTVLFSTAKQIRTLALTQFAFLFLCTSPTRLFASKKYVFTHTHTHLRLFSKILFRLWKYEERENKGKKHMVAVWIGHCACLFSLRFVYVLFRQTRIYKAFWIKRKNNGSDIYTFRQSIHTQVQRTMRNAKNSAAAAAAAAKDPSKPMPRRAASTKKSLSVWKPF